MELMAPISPGELLDKLTILEIKKERIVDPDKRVNVIRELEVLSALWAKASPASEHAAALGLDAMRAELKTINQSLWTIEDDIRACESRQDFGPQFIELARAVYQTNDRRAAIKKQINQALGSDLVEEKSYSEY